MRKRKKNPPSWTVLGYALAGVGIYLLYRKYRGLSDNAFPEGYAQDIPVPIVPTTNYLTKPKTFWGAVKSYQPLPTFVPKEPALDEQQIARITESINLYELKVPRIVVGQSGPTFPRIVVGQSGPTFQGLPVTRPQLVPKATRRELLFYDKETPPSDLIPSFSELQKHGVSAPRKPMELDQLIKEGYLRKHSLISQPMTVIEEVAKSKMAEHVHMSEWNVSQFEEYTWESKQKRWMLQQDQKDAAERLEDLLTGKNKVAPEQLQESLFIEEEKIRSTLDTIQDLDTKANDCSAEIERRVHSSFGSGAQSMDYSAGTRGRRAYEKVSKPYMDKFLERVRKATTMYNLS